MKKTEAQLRREIDKAGDKLFGWLAQYEDVLEYWYETRKGQSLKAKYGTDNVADKVEADGIEIYEPGGVFSDKREKVTSKAIKRLRYLEKKIAEWEEKSCEAEMALDTYWIDAE